jgi:nicotinic acid phosphoribosyltransferase
MTSNLLRAADESMNSLLSWGIGGIILAVFVAPTFYIMVKAAQARDESRTKREDDEVKRTSDRVDRLIDALSKSVDQQKQALEQWRLFEVQEEKVHAALLAGLSQLTALITAQQRAAESTANSQTQIASLLDNVARQLGELRKPA